MMGVDLELVSYRAFFLAALNFNYKQYLGIAFFHIVSLDEA